MKLQVLFDIIFATIMIAFIHLLIIILTPGPIHPDVLELLKWFSN